MEKHIFLNNTLIFLPILFTPSPLSDLPIKRAYFRASLEYLWSLYSLNSKDPSSGNDVST